MHFYDIAAFLKTGEIKKDTGGIEAGEISTCEFIDAIKLTHGMLLEFSERGALIKKFIFEATKYLK